MTLSKGLKVTWQFSLEISNILSFKTTRLGSGFRHMGKESLYIWSMIHDQDGPLCPCMVKTFKNFLP